MSTDARGYIFLGDEVIGRGEVEVVFETDEFYRKYAALPPVALPTAYAMHAADERALRRERPDLFYMPGPLPAFTSLLDMSAAFPRSEVVS